jgi:hypothetical protein
MQLDHAERRRWVHEIDQLARHAVGDEVPPW